MKHFITLLSLLCCSVLANAAPSSLPDCIHATTAGYDYPAPAVKFSVTPAPFTYTSPAPNYYAKTKTLYSPAPITYSEPAPVTPAAIEFKPLLSPQPYYTAPKFTTHTYLPPPPPPPAPSPLPVVYKQPLLPKIVPYIPAAPKFEYLPPPPPKFEYLPPPAAPKFEYLPPPPPPPAPKLITYLPPPPAPKVVHYVAPAPKPALYIPPAPKVVQYVAPAPKPAIYLSHAPKVVQYVTPAPAYLAPSVAKLPVYSPPVSSKYDCFSAPGYTLPAYKAPALTYAPAISHAPIGPTLLPKSPFYTGSHSASFAQNAHSSQYISKPAGLSYYSAPKLATAAYGHTASAGGAVSHQYVSKPLGTVSYAAPALAPPPVLAKTTLLSAPAFTSSAGYAYKPAYPKLTAYAAPAVSKLYAQEGVAKYSSAGGAVSHQYVSKPTLTKLVASHSAPYYDAPPPTTSPSRSSR